MISIAPQNASDTKITVTDTATSLYDLIDTASSTKNAQQYYDSKFADSVVITPRDGDVRYLVNGTPTSDLGTLLSAGVTYYLPRTEPFAFKLIRAGGTNVVVDAVLYRAEQGENPTAVAYDISIETGALTIGNVKLQDGDSSTLADVETDSSKNALYVQSETIAQDSTLTDGTQVTKIAGLSGTGTDGTVALASANTWYAVPDSAPSNEYVLTVSKENADGTIRWSFTNGGTPSATNGNKLSGSDVSVLLAGSEVLYFGSDTAGDDVNWTAKET